MTRSAFCVFAVVVLALSCGSVRADLTAYWSFDADYTSSVNSATMNGTPVNNVSITAGAARVGAGGLQIDDEGTLQDCMRVDNPVAYVPETITDPATDIPIITVAGWYNRTSIGGTMDDRSTVWCSGGGPGTANNFTVSLNIQDTGTCWSYDTRSAPSSTFNDLSGPAVTDPFISFISPLVETVSQITA